MAIDYPSGGTSGTLARREKGANYHEPKKVLNTASSTPQYAASGANAAAAARAQAEAEAAARAQQYANMIAQVQANGSGRINQFQTDWNTQLNNLNNTYQQYYNRLKQSFDDLYNLRKTNYDYGTGQLNQSIDKAQQEAYVNRMMQERGLNQRMAAMGKTGGATESTMLGMANNYGKVRGQNEQTRNTNLANLWQEYNTTLTGDQTQYNQQLTGYQQSHLQNKLNTDQYYQNMIDKVRQEQAAYELQLQMAQIR